MPSPDSMPGRERYYAELDAMDKKVLQRKPDMWGGTATEYRKDLNLDHELSGLPSGAIIYDAGSFHTARGVDELYSHYDKRFSFVAVNHSFLEFKGRRPRIRTIPSPIEEMDHNLETILGPQGLFPANVIMCRKVLNMIAHQIYERVAPPRLIDWAFQSLMASIQPTEGKVLIYEEYDDSSDWQEHLYGFYADIISGATPGTRIEILSNPANNQYMRLT